MFVSFRKCSPPQKPDPISDRNCQNLYPISDQNGSKTITQTARLILRERVDFARQQPDRNRQNRAATVDSCFVLIGTRQHGVAVLYETSDRASSNKMQPNPCPVKFRTLNLPAPRITRCHTTCLRDMRGDLRQNYVSNCVMQNLQFFLLAIKFFSNEIGAVIGIPQKKLKKQNRI